MSIEDDSEKVDFYPHEIEAKEYYQANSGQTDNPVFGPIMPAGAIIMWGSETIPDGWALCDGQNNPDPHSGVEIPDLRDKFIMGAVTQNTESYEKLGEQGEGDTHTHQIIEWSKDLHTSTANAHTHGGLFGSNTHIEYDPSPILGEREGSIWDIDSEPSSTKLDGAHSHTVTVDFGNIQTSSSNVLKPKWYALCFIIKL